MHISKVVATTRRLPSSDSGAFVDWAATPSSSVTAAAVSGRVTAPVDELSLGFNATPATADGHGGSVTGMWPGANSRPINYSHVAQDMLSFMVAPTYHHHNHNETLVSDSHSLNSSNPATALGVGVIPLLTSSHGGGIQLWQEQHQQQHQQQGHHHHHHHYLKKHVLLEHDNSDGDCGGITGLVTTGGGTTCQDCGNQAKKDCTHRRCRTCCKSRGYDCPTHVKSTWVPAARRRERQLMAVAAAAAGSSGSTSDHAKKPRLVASQTTTTSHTSTSNNTPPRSFDTTSSHQDASFRDSLPHQVRAPAVFKCVRVMAVDDGEDEYAYQAVVKIGGHVFKGFLYDQGVDDNKEAYPNLSELHLGNVGSGNGDRNGVSSSSPMMDPSNVYAASGGGFLGGSSTYGNPMN